MDEPDKDKERMCLVMEAYDRSRKTYGYRRIGIWIEREYDLKINHKAVLRLMQKLNICSVARKRNPYRQINNRYGAIHTYPNLLKQNFHAEKPNQKWGTDITYIRTQQGFVYLAVIKDFFDKSILGYALSKNFSIRLVLNALNMASENGLSSQGVILQSDQGPQYQSAPYHQLTSKYGIIPSMSRPENCLDNAPTESFFSHLKEEWLRGTEIADFAHAIEVVESYIHFYNHDRIQLKTKLTPFELRCQFV
jgi:putative transposase